MAAGGAGAVPWSGRRRRAHDAGLRAARRSGPTGIGTEPPCRSARSADGRSHRRYLTRRQFAASAREGTRNSDGFSLSAEHESTRSPLQNSAVRGSWPSGDVTRPPPGSPDGRSDAPRRGAAGCPMALPGRFLGRRASSRWSDRHPVIRRSLSYAATQSGSSMGGCPPETVLAPCSPAAARAGCRCGCTLAVRVAKWAGRGRRSRPRRGGVLGVGRVCGHHGFAL